MADKENSIFSYFRDISARASSTDLSDFNKNLLLCIILLVLLIPSLFLSYLKYIDNFFWWSLSSVSSALYRGQLTIDFPLQSSNKIILYSISSICGLSPLELATIPIGGFVVPIFYFVLSKKFFKSNLIAILLVTYVAYDFTLFASNYNVSTYTWTRSLFLTFVLLYVLYLQSDNWKFITLIIPVFATTFHLHPTYTSWMMIFSFSVSALVIFARMLGLNKVSFRSAINLSLVFVISYLGFNKLFYDTWLRNIISIELDMISYEFLSMIKSYLGMVEPLVEPYALPVAPPTTIMGYALFIRTSIILGTLLIASLLWIKGSYRDLSGKVDNDIILMVALFMVGFLHVFAYVLYGHMSLRFVTLIYPIITLITLKKINDKKLVQIAFLISIVFLAFLQTGSFVVENYNKPNNIMYDTRPSSMWLLNKLSNQATVLSDFETSQVFYFYFKSENKSFNQRFYDSEVYNMLVNPINTPNKKLKNACSYVIINNITSTRPTSYRGWKYYEPLSYYLDEISSNFDIHKIYDDAKIWIFKTR